MDSEIRASVVLAARRTWQRVLRIDEVSLADDFFELGGRSLAAMRVVLMLRRDLADGIGVELLLKNPQFTDFVDAVSSYLDRRRSALRDEDHAGTSDAGESPEGVVSAGTP